MTRSEDITRRCAKVVKQLYKLGEFGLSDKDVVKIMNRVIDKLDLD